MLAGKVMERIAQLHGVSGWKEITVEGDTSLDFSEFDVTTDAGVILVSVGDAAFLHQHREALQGRAKESRGGRSATMVYAYPFTLCRRAVVATMDLSARNFELFTNHHWLSDNPNATSLQLTESAFVAT